MALSEGADNVVPSKRRSDMSLKSEQIIRKADEIAEDKEVGG
jgi:hypothetical protein